MDMKTLNDEDIKKIVLSWHMLLSVCFIWSLGAVGGIAFSSWIFYLDRELSLHSVVPLVFGGVQALAVYGTFTRKQWSRPYGILLCMPMLIGFPLVTIIGVTGLWGYRDAKPIFGASQDDFNMLKSRYNELKA